MASKSLHDAARSTLRTDQGNVTYYRLGYLQEAGLVQDLQRLPVSIRVMLENVLRNADGTIINDDDVRNALTWSAKHIPDKEFPFMPARVLLQDFTGVPAVVDLAALRSAMKRAGADPQRINPLVRSDLVIDHSVQVDYFGNDMAFTRNVDLEMERNSERYQLLRWAQKAFKNFSVVPPGTGICHQVNLEYLASVVEVQTNGKDKVAFPDTLVGLDSHTTMVNGLAVLGWGVGGIEAEAVMLGQPYYMLLPEVVGFKLTGVLREGVTATDLVLTATEMLRKKGVVNKVVEFYGPGLSKLPVPDRATIANMSPEYGATAGFFPIDKETLAYMRGTARTEAQIKLTEQYARAQGIFRTDDTPDPVYTDTLTLDMGTVVPSLAGPRRPQDRVALKDMKKNFRAALIKEFGKAHLAGESDTWASEGGQHPAVASRLEEFPGHNISTPEATLVTLDNGQKVHLDHGSVVIAAITSCTNTSNPSVMIGAGLLAKNAVERGLKTKPWVKTSLAPGSRVVQNYLENSQVLPYLEQLGFYIVGFGCTTCIGNSGPLPDAVGNAVTEKELIGAAVISGNRNFEGRVHPQVQANYLASPMLVVAYALAGTVDVDLTTEPIGVGKDGKMVFLKDIWPSQDQIREEVTFALKPEIFKERYGEVFEGDAAWKGLPVPEGEIFSWDEKSTYVREVPFFQDLSKEPAPLKDVKGARALAVLGDSVTTDHISPAGAIPVSSPAGQYLIGQGVKAVDFNQYGARRGNHEVMMRGTFGNIRLKNFLTPDKSGDWTLHLPDNKEMRIFEASMQYQKEGTPLVVIAGKEYGTGSSRDWAAKGPMLLGIKVAIAESFERIHRSNLIGMGVLPLQFKPGDSAQKLGITGRESFDVEGLAKGLTPGKEVKVTVRRDDGKTFSFTTICRIDTEIERQYHLNGGVLNFVLRRILKESEAEKGKAKK